MQTQNPRLRLSGISKSFTGVRALHKVDFELAAGEVHALLGENGAGKSTLIKAITGVYTPDAGAITLDGKNLFLRNTTEAQAAGISTVYQEVNLLPNLSVAHNLFMGREPRKFGCIQWKKIVRDAQALLQDFNLDIDVTQNLGSFPIAIQQLVAIARGVACSAKVLILDEPTASLDAKEVALLFTIVRKLKADGIGIIFVTHFLDQVYAISDRITVLRNGELVGTFQTDALPRHELIGHMLGKALQAVDKPANQAATQDSHNIALSAHKLCANNGLQDVSFTVEQGTALGLAGLLGSGRTELCEALFGLSEIHAGTLTLNNKACSPSKPREAIRLHMALCPEDRKKQGIVGPLSIRENIILALQAQKGLWKRIPKHQQEKIAQEAIAELGIATPNSEKPIAQLSGGNQQKVILARWLAAKPNILILDEPTRGIDIGAHAEIIKLIRNLCARGMTTLVASSETEELAAFSDKVIVLRDKKLAAELSKENISEDAILSAIAEGG